MVIYLTGATGLAGAAIAGAAERRGHKVIGVGLTEEKEPVGLFRFLRLDLSDDATVTSSLLEHFPDVIINAAAVSEASICERDPDQSARINVGLPTTLARLAHHLSARLIQISTDMVFDGCEGGYKPDSPTRPLSVYGQQKLEAEKQMTGLAPDFSTIVRTTLLTGNSLSGKRSVHERLFEMWAANCPAQLFTDEIRQPCSAENLAEAIVEISERNDLFGISHWAGATPLSRYEIGRRILARFKLPAELVEKTSIQDDPKFSARPANLTLDTSRLTSRLKTRPLSFGEQLESFNVPVPFRDWYNNL